MKQSDRPSYRQWYRSNKLRICAKQREWQLANPELVKGYQRKWAKQNRPKLRAKLRRQYAANKEQYVQYARDARKRLRAEFIAAYGGECQCCGERESAFLTLEHKNRDGKQHRQQFSTSSQILADLRRRGWPKAAYALFCFNCNRASWEQGVCPHQQRKELGEKDDATRL